MGSLTLRLEAYDPHARKMVAGAQSLADDRDHTEVEPLHLLYVLVERDEVAQEAIRRAGADPTDVLVEAESQARRFRTLGDSMAYLSPRLLELLGRAEGEAAREKGSPVGVKHLLLALAQETSRPTQSVMQSCGLSAPILRATLAGEDITRKKEASPSGGSQAEGDPLEAFGRDYTRMAAQDRFDPTVGRDAELRRIMQVLARRRENNPLLVGEAGIGKTAIVQALASRIAAGDVPNMLRDKRIIALDMGAMVAGAKLRGQLEERMRGVLAAVRDS
ncbi:MAG: Clp protease N-terminal domain-containing protein, partial [Myxococcota bacterium]